MSFYSQFATLGLMLKNITNNKKGSFRSLLHYVPNNQKYKKFLPAINYAKYFSKSSLPPMCLPPMNTCGTVERPETARTLTIVAS